VSDFSNEFMRGYNACKAGYPCGQTHSNAYKRGYETRYTEEQVASEMGRKTRTK
tara:strand:- start:260 stop:421 length:162 start_codon:yes stop_codon:yes gene_type:complete